MGYSVPRKTVFGHVSGRHGDAHQKSVASGSFATPPTGEHIPDLGRRQSIRYPIHPATFAQPQALCARTAAPIAVDRTRGAFYQGMRLMAIDGVAFDFPDTSGNAAAFGRPKTRRYGKPVEGGYPQIHMTFL